jgi:hypothetical protein
MPTVSIGSIGVDACSSVVRVRSDSGLAHTIKRMEKRSTIPAQLVVYSRISHDTKSYWIRSENFESHHRAKFIRLTDTINCQRTAAVFGDCIQISVHGNEWVRYAVTILQRHRCPRYTATGRIRRGTSRLSSREKGELRVTLIYVRF